MKTGAFRVIAQLALLVLVEADDIDRSVSGVSIWVKSPSSGQVVLVRPGGQTSAEIWIRMPDFEECPEPPWWLEVVAHANTSTGQSTGEIESDSKVAVEVPCSCFPGGGCYGVVHQPMPHDDLLQACNRPQLESAQSMWDDSARQDLGWCAQGMDVTVTESSGELIGDVSVWFWVGDIVLPDQSAVARNAAGAGFVCREDIPLMVGKTGIQAIELGVNEGDFSEKMLNTGVVGHLYSLDAWTDAEQGHGPDQYWRAIQLLRPFGESSTVLRATFDDAIGFFPDEYFDVVYIDGYAHTGQEGGQTLGQWWEKVAPGGLLAGHDYDANAWPLTFHNVNVFANARNLEVLYTSDTCEDADQVPFQSWMIRKGQ